MSKMLYTRILPVVLAIVVTSCVDDTQVPLRPDMPDNWGQYKVLVDHPNYLALRTYRVDSLEDMIHSYIDDGWQVHIATAYVGRFDIAYIVEFRRCNVEVRK